MAEIRVNPTRMELKKLQTRYTTARRGHKLLKDKRDGLMKEFLEVVREDKDIRLSVEKSLASVYRSFTEAGASMSPKMMEEALICPKKECSLDVRFKNLMSVTVPVFQTEMKVAGAADGGTLTGSDNCNYGFAFTSGELDRSVSELARLLPALLRMAELEKRAQLLAEEIEKTRRRVNALEYIMIPQYLRAIKSIRMKLDENERGNTTRLMKVKDMMLKEQIQNKHPDEDEEDDGAEPSAKEN